MLTERPDVERIKRKNIIDMALGFTAITRIFSVRSKIEAQLEVVFASLAEINARTEYEARHESCGSRAMKCLIVDCFVETSSTSQGKL